MSFRVEYANVLSRVILKPSFERQFILPLEPLPGFIERFLKWYERSVMKVDISDIQVDRPIFLVGVPRSGTTMVQDVLCAHPHVAYFTNAMNQYRNCFCAAEDIRKRLKLGFKGERYLQDGVEIQPGSPNEGLTFLVEWRQVDPYALDYVEFHPGDTPPENIARAHETIRKVIWSLGGETRRFFNKNPGLLPYTLKIKELFPDVRIIHIVRDARMCANSMLKLCLRHQAQEKRIRRQLKRTSYGNGCDALFIPYPRLPKLAEYVEQYGPDDIRTTAHLWDDGISMVNEDKNHLPHFYEVRYEDILDDPEREMLKLCEFCELPIIQDRTAKFWQKIAEISKDVPKTGGYGEFDVVESICCENMDRYGYL
jgi:hypothetical protein